MIGFKAFISEEHVDDLKVVHISEDISHSLEQINQLFDNQLSEELNNPYTGWLWSSKILESFGIELPKVTFSDINEGIEVVELKLNESSYYFYYEYELNESNQYETFATITDESGLDELLNEE